jgi:hypothetical protein
MGTKRVGLARTQALIQGLKRELSLGGTTFLNAKDGKMTQGAGTVIANDTAAVSLTASDSGKAIISNLASAAKVVSIATGQVVGWTVRIVQATALAGSGQYTINLVSGTDTFCVGTYANVYGLAAGGKHATASNDQLVIAGAATNSGHGRGSTIDITCVAANKYLIEVNGSMLGSGNDAYTFNTQ